MKAVIQVGVRRQGRVRGHEGPYVSVTEHRIDVPEEFIGKELCVAVSVREVHQALAHWRGAERPGAPELDTIEFRVEFEK